MRVLLWFAALMLLSPWGAQAACTISSATLAFGVYTGALLNTGTGSLTVKCTSGTAYAVGVDSGLHQGGGNYNWNMIGPASTLLHYELFRNVGRSALWGNTPNTDTFAGTGNGAAQTVNFYARIPANAQVAPGSYTDTVTMFVYSSFATVSASMAVSVTVPTNCTISANPLNFGNYTGLVLNGTTTLAVTCTNTTTYQIGADNGQNAQFIGVWAKYMLGPSGNKLRYHLYPNAARSIEWGTTAGTDEVAGTGTGIAQTITVYGTVGAGSYGSAPGAYSDTVTITITY